MKKLFIALAAIVSFASCKKENVETTTSAAQTTAPQLSTDKKLKIKITSVFGIETGDYNFDLKGRAIGSVQVINGVTRTMQYDYTVPGRISVTMKDDGVLKRSYTCDMNLKGNIVKLYEFKPDGTLDATNTYTYDANDYVVKCEWVTAANTSGRYDYVITNGNITESKAYITNTLQRTNTFTYDAAKINKQENAFSSFFRGSSFGSSNKNLIMNFKTISASGTLQRNTDYQYEYDAAGTATKLTSFDNVAAYTEVENYTYQ